MKIEKMALHRCRAKSCIIYIVYQRHNALASTIQRQKCIEDAPWTMHAVAKKKKQNKSKNKQKVTKHRTMTMGYAK